MTIQRSRRATLAAAVGTAGILAGCTGVIGSVVDRRPEVSILAAGSLQNTLHSLAERSEYRVTFEAHGSAAVARLVASGRRDPDLVVLADTTLFERLLSVEWYAGFATNALVVAYTTETRGGRRVAAADRWFDPVIGDEAALGRTDPDLDPLGYRTRFMLDLTATHIDRPGLTDAVLAPDQVFPETELLAQFETGAIDAAVVYRSMAEERGFDYRELPPAVDLSDPGLAPAYRELEYHLSDGTVVTGGPIQFGATMRRTGGASEDVFRDLVHGHDRLESHGFTVPAGYPEWVGIDPVRART